MHYSITGFAYLTLLVTLGYLIYRFFQYWKKEKDTVARQSFYFTGLFGLFVLINTVSGLFFADNSFLLEKISGAASFIQVLAFAAMAYHIVFLKFIPLIIILFSQFKNSDNLYIKGKALGMGLVLLFILLGASFDFLFINIFGLNPIWRDIVFMICSAILLITLILTLPRSSYKHE